MKTLCFLWIGFFLFPHFIACTDGTGKSIDKDQSTSALTKKFDENVILSVVKGLIEFASNGFKSGLEASVRSLFNKPMTTAVYALSMLVGVVAMLAFYESPISPMPVPPLPDPPVGRFPPEHPIWPPINQQQPQQYRPNMNDYHQKRSGMAPQLEPIQYQYPSMAAYVQNYYPNQHSDNHRSDKNPAPVMRTNKFVLPSHMNETSYNNYISKLTAAFEQNNNGNKLNNNQNQPNIDQLKQVYSSNPELSNKVIDYNNKRIAVESIKYSNNNQTIS